MAFPLSHVAQNRGFAHIIFIELKTTFYGLTKCIHKHLQDGYTAGIFNVIQSSHI